MAMIISKILPIGTGDLRRRPACPLVSVVIPVRNGGPYIDECIASVLTQSLSDLEIIAVDDGSIDDSLDRLRRHARKDERVKVHRNRGPSGIAIALNIGLAEARGQYIARLDADDVALPNRLEQQARFLEEHRNVDLLGSALDIIDAQGHFLRSHYEPTGWLAVWFHTLFGTPFAHPSMMMRAEIFRKHGFRYREVPAQDYELWVRVLNEGFRGDNLGEPLTRYRVHEDSESTVRSDAYSRAANELSARQRQHFGCDIDGSHWARVAALAHTALTGNPLLSTNVDLDSTRSLLLVLDRFVSKVACSKNDAGHLRYVISTQLSRHLSNTELLRPPTSANFPPRLPYTEVPIVINSYNRLTSLRKLVVWLRGSGYKNLIVVDNHSDYKPLVEYLEEEQNKGLKVVRLGRNLGPLSLWHADLLGHLEIASEFVYTDPDVVPAETCPQNVVQVMQEILLSSPEVSKVGLGLQLDDLPSHYALKEQVLTWERQFWLRPAAAGLFWAPVDTTFALYRPYSGHEANSRNVRTGRPFVARHEGWYINHKNPTEEDEWYLQRTLPGASHWVFPDPPRHLLDLLGRNGHQSYPRLLSLGIFAPTESEGYLNVPWEAVSSLSRKGAGFVGIYGVLDDAPDEVPFSALAGVAAESATIVMHWGRLASNKALSTERTQSLLSQAEKAGLFAASVITSDSTDDAAGSSRGFFHFSRSPCVASEASSKLAALDFWQGFAGFEANQSLTAAIRQSPAQDGAASPPLPQGDEELCLESGLFDAQWYLVQNPDVGAAGVDPLDHFLKWGGVAGRDPGPQFRASWYLDTYRDVARAGINPLVHYLRYGAAEGRVRAPLPRNDVTRETRNSTEERVDCKKKTINTVSRSLTAAIKGRVASVANRIQDGRHDGARCDWVVGCLTRYSFDDIRMWVNSLDRCGFTGSKIVLCAEVEEATIRELERRNYVILRFSMPDNDPYEILKYRYLEIARLLAKGPAESCRFVIAPDMKDVIFQRNPSEWLTRNAVAYQLVAGSECLIHEHEDWSRGMMLEMFGDELYELVRNKEVYNAGTMSGKVGALSELYFCIYSMMSRKSPRFGVYPDQAAANLLLHLGPFNRTTKFAPAESGWACQAGTTAAPRVIEKYRPTLTEPEPILNDTHIATSVGVQYHLVHQYDRVPEWKALFRQLYW